MQNTYKHNSVHNPYCDNYHSCNLWLVAEDIVCTILEMMSPCWLVFPIVKYREFQKSRLILIL